jgi:hypothetical protein
MRVSFVKLSDEQHALEVVREDGRREHVVCETRSYFLHDLLHFAVESEGALTGGFWGRLAQGMTLAEMNDRKRPVGPESEELAAIEQLVGALHGATKGQSAEELVAGMRRFAEALDASLPDWLTEPFVLRVKERLRQLRGRWNATPYGTAMDLDWI